ncbi:MAG TPA: VWA domain-containing protein [Bryobacteraceae bacterium]|nr:VWA domain-containing protein [Bryobacteraceae bacterium]
MLRSGIVLALPLTLFCQEDIATFRTSVSVVRVDALVTDRTGRSVGNLERTDFRVFDENQPREIVGFNRETEPLDLVLLLDVSGSMSRVLGEMSNRATEALRQLRPGDRVAVMVFAERQQTVQDFTEERSKIGESITNSVFKTQWGQGTIYNDALLQAVRSFDQGKKKGRRSLLLVTDGQGTAGKVSNAEVSRALQDADVVMNAILVGRGESGSNSRYRDPSGAPPDISEYVRSTGGEIVSGTDAAKLLKGIVASIATRYSLEYPAPQGEPGSFRSIRVELTDEARKRHTGAVIKARTGYHVDAQ